MPKGYIITQWTEDEGLIAPVCYPEQITVDLDDMMRIFYAHITGAGEAGNVLVRLERARSNVSSYFTGMESEVPLMINLMLELGEDPDMFGEAVIREINGEILKYLNQMGTNISETYEIIEKLKIYLKNALFLLDRLKNMTKEQRMAQIYSTERGKAILALLQERARSRKELQTLLEEKLDTIISNFEITLDPFIKTDLVKQDWIEGFSDILLFLISDFTISRAPVIKLVENAKKDLPNSILAKSYLENVKEFFSNYNPTLEDNLVIALNMINPDKFDYIALFRERAYPLNKIPKGPGEGSKKVIEMLKLMEEDKIITIVKDNKNIEWVFLLTEISVQSFFPEYIIEQIRRDQIEGKLKKEVAIKHLELLEKSYTKPKKGGIKVSKVRKAKKEKVIKTEKVSESKKIKLKQEDFSGSSLEIQRKIKEKKDEIARVEEEATREEISAKDEINAEHDVKITEIEDKLTYEQKKLNYSNEKLVEWNLKTKEFKTSVKSLTEEFNTLKKEKSKILSSKLKEISKEKNAKIKAIQGEISKEKEKKIIKE